VYAVEQIPNLLQATRQDLLPEVFSRWFSGRGWTLRQHQEKLLVETSARRSVLLIAPTGAGKTLAGFLPSLVRPARASEATAW